MKSKELLTLIKKLAEKRAPSGLEEHRAAVFKTEVNKLLQKWDIPKKTMHTEIIT